MLYRIGIIMVTNMVRVTGIKTMAKVTKANHTVVAKVKTVSALNVADNTAKQTHAQRTGKLVINVEK